MTHDPAPVGPSHLAAVTGYSRPTVAAALRRLESMALVHRPTPGHDAWARIPNVKIFYLSAPLYNYNDNNKAESAPADAISQLLALHAAEVGPPSPAIKTKLTRLLHQYPDLAHWHDAYTAAAVHNKRSLAYVIRCVQNRGTLTDTLRRQARFDTL